MKDVEPRHPLGTALDRGRAVTPEPSGGDPACWLDHVCDACGRLTEACGSICPRCGEALG